jgi:hypothetical protein
MKTTSEQKNNALRYKPEGRGLISEGAIEIFH